MPNTLKHHRLGLAVSKKVSKKAVERNRIKRQLRDSFRHFQSSLGEIGGIEAGIDFVAVAKPAAARADNATLRQEVDRLWRKAASRLAA